jgi:hypothetical protein
MTPLLLEQRNVRKGRGRKMKKETKEGKGKVVEVGHEK